MADPTGMVAAANVAAGGKPAKSDSDILTVARARLDMAVSALMESREDEIDDLRFYAGSPDNHWQWPAGDQNGSIGDSAREWPAPAHRLAVTEYRD